MIIFALQVLQQGKWKKEKHNTYVLPSKKPLPRNYLRARDGGWLGEIEPYVQRITMTSFPKLDAKALMM